MKDGVWMTAGMVLEGRAANPRNPPTAKIVRIMIWKKRIFGVIMKYTNRSIKDEWLLTKKEFERSKWKISSRG